MGERVRLALGDALSVLVDHRGRTPKKLGGTFANSGVPVISAKCIRDGRVTEDDRRFVSRDMFLKWMPVPLRSGDVLMTSEAPLGEVAWWDEDAPVCLGQRLFALRANPAVVDSRFLYYVLRSREVQAELHARATGTTAHGIRQSQLVQVVLDLPALELQRRVSQLLGALDDKIDVNHRIAETLEQIARSLFASWFVDFDPVRGIATVPEDVRRFFPDRLVGSPIGSVPAGWEVVPLGDLVEVTRGLSYTSAGLADEGLPLHNLDSIREGGGYKEEGIKYYVGEFRDRDRVHPSDLIVASTEQGFEHLLIGYPAIVPRSFGDDGLYSQDLCRLRPLDGSSITPRWLYLLLVGHRIHHLVAGYSNGTTVNHLSMDGFRKPSIVIPPREVLKLFDALVAPMFDQQEALTAESRTLAELRDTLLPKLISGEIRLPAA